MQQRFVQSLGYIGLTSPNIDQWKMFAQEMLGMELNTRPNGSIALKMDEKSHRYLIEPSSKSGLHFMGFDVGEPFHLHQLEKHLTEAGIKVHSISSEEKKAKKEVAKADATKSATPAVAKDTKTEAVKK